MTDDQFISKPSIPKSLVNCQTPSSIEMENEYLSRIQANQNYLSEPTFISLFASVSEIDGQFREDSQIRFDLIADIHI